jgi:F0F1-type ATP synthase membrane subunit b/b'
VNAARREQIGTIADAIEQLRVDLESLRDEEQEYFDNMPESFQQAQKGQDAEAAVDSLSESVDGLDEVVSNLRGLE